MESQTRKMIEEFHHQSRTLLHDPVNMSREPCSTGPRPKSGLVADAQLVTGSTSATASQQGPSAIALYVQLWQNQL